MVKRTTTRVTANFVWQCMRLDIKEYVQRCKTCQEVKYIPTSPQGKLQLFPIPCKVRTDLSMDFITHLPSSFSKTAIMVVVDKLSKCSHFVVLPPSFTTESVAKVFVKEIAKLHGFPQNVISDRYLVFMSAF